jgi:ElaB/YqjD/DUF883 family membrane-anchored ribosome-binding protein
MNEETLTASHEQRIVEDLRTVIRDTETLLRHAASDASALTAEARHTLEGQLERARVRLQEVEQVAAARAKEAARATDTWVREHPWQAVGIGVGAGLVLGLLLGRK